MKRAWAWWAVVSVGIGLGADEPGQKAAESRVAAVTVYEDSALVTREVVVPEGKGTVDLLVTPLPAAVVGTSLYTEASGDLRVLSTRYRTRAVREDSRAAVRELDEQLRQLQQKKYALEEAKVVSEKNLELLQKLEGFTAASLTQLTEKGRLDAEGTIELADQIMQRRDTIARQQVETTEQINALRDSIALAERRRAELAEGTSRTERDALISVDRGEGNGGSIRLSYLVENAHWEPQYRFRAGAENEPVQMEYLAAIEQQTGEDWNGINLTLSTSQPSLNAAPPPLLALDVDLSPGMMGMAGMGMGGMGGMGGGMMGGMAIPNEEGEVPGPSSLKEVLEQSRIMREQAQLEERSGDSERKGDLVNEAAALEQTGELLARGEEGKAEGEPEPNEGGAPSLLFRLEGARTIPSRSDQQLVEVAQLALKADF
ncbi:MAG TPA: mucoidy inhibitor MuiA family protein, partial [Isosphaeraceae bacterium]|nr:mucoidy inhibitor MuiA family protein [Isosphaeraceae bacterium]